MGKWKKVFILRYERIDQRLPGLHHLPIEQRIGLIKKCNPFWVNVTYNELILFFLITLYISLYKVDSDQFSTRIFWLSFTIASSTCLMLIAFTYDLLTLPLRKHRINLELLRLSIRPQYCLLCQYDLRGTPDESTACPECGAAIAAVTPQPEE